MHILVIEDNAELAGNVGDYLEATGHTADFALDGRHGLEFALAGRFDIIVLDLALPGMDGLDICAQLRAAGAGTPVLMLTARDTLADKLDGFEVGADDYLVKPFSLEELVARITALHRRARGESAQRTLRVGDLEYDPLTESGRRNGRELRLRPAQRRLLAHLMRNSHRVVARSELEAALWGDDPPDNDLLRAHIHLLRNAIDRDHPVKLLHTVPGTGYRLTAPE